MRSVPPGADFMAQSGRAIYWSAIIADFHRSGLTHVEFCRRRQISIHSSRHWLYRRRPHLRPTPSVPAPTPAIPHPTPAFLPVRIRPEPIPVVIGSPDAPTAPVGWGTGARTVGSGGGSIPFGLGLSPAPMATSPAAPPKIPYGGFSPVRLQVPGTAQFSGESSHRGGWLKCDPHIHHLPG